MKNNGAAAQDAVRALGAMIQGFDVIDLSPTLSDHMPQFRRHPALEIDSTARTGERDGYNLHTLTLPEHVGAHVDAPVHVPGLIRTIDSFPITWLWGRCITVDASEHDWQPGELLSAEDFLDDLSDNDIAIEAGDVVLVNFGWTRHLLEGGLGADYWGANSPGFDEELCRYLFEHDVRAVGTDTTTGDLSQIDGADHTTFGHTEYFLPNDILVIEGLANLGVVPPVSFFAAMPLKIDGGTGSPLRPAALVPRLQ